MNPISWIIDGIISAGIKWLQSLQQRREDKDAGRKEQHTADVEATNKEAQNVAVIREQVQTMDDSALDADLERVRHDAASGHL